MTKINTNINDVERYIAGFPIETQKILEQIRTTIKKAAPDAVETIKYAIPTFTLNGNLISYAAYKNHIGLYPAPGGDDNFKNEISAYKTAKSTVRLPLEQPIPYDLISRIIKFRILETTEKAKTKLNLLKPASKS